LQKLTASIFCLKQGGNSFLAASMQIRHGFLQLGIIIVLLESLIQFKL